MNKKIWIGIVAILLIAVVVFVMQKGGQPQHEEIKIGAILPMTGSGAQYGEEVRRGMEIAIGEINDAGGVKSVPLALCLEDSATDPKTATLAFEKLTAIKRIQVIVTEVSGVVMALAPKANDKKVILFNVGAQNPKIREAGPYVFSNINDASVESKLLAEFTFKNLNAKKAAVLYADVAYGEGARSIFSNEFRRLGGTIVSEVSFREDALDFRAQIGEVRGAKPEVVYLPGHTKDMAKILKQAYELGFKPQWLSYTAFEGEDVIRIAGKGAEGVIYTSMSLDYESASPITKGFIEKFRSRYSSEPGIYSTTGYDAVLMTNEAIKSIGNDATKIRKFFLSMPAFEGASGVTEFLPNGAVEKPLIFKTVRNGKFVVYRGKE